MSARLPKDQLRAAMRAGVVELLDELYREDGFDEPLAAAGKRVCPELFRWDNGDGTYSYQRGTIQREPSRRARR